jgi:hypothetical protein
LSIANHFFAQLNGYEIPSAGFYRLRRRQVTRISCDPAGLLGLARCSRWRDGPMKSGSESCSFSARAPLAGLVVCSYSAKSAWVMSQRPRAVVIMAISLSTNILAATRTFPCASTALTGSGRQSPKCSQTGQRCATARFATAPQRCCNFAAV